MSDLGLGVMISMLGGNADTVAALNASIGKKISSVEVTTSDELRIAFDDTTSLIVMDDGQSCCEHRYMTTDDDMQSFVGDVFIGLELKDAPDIQDEYGEHQCQFLEVKTDKGCFTMTNHNEHNGYYGGFSIACKLGE